MTDKIPKRRLAVLWFIAAALSFIAVAIRFSDDGEMNWPIVASGTFCLIMGIAALARSRKAPPST